jgi:cytochrome b561
MRRSLTTRVLHVLVAGAVIHQLVVSWFMEVPKPNGLGGNFAFQLHETIGLGSLGVLTVFWLWTLVRRGEYNIGDLVPWFSMRRRQVLFADLGNHLRLAIKARLPDPSNQGGLPSAIHGLGLLVATGMAVTGAAVAVFPGGAGALTSIARVALEIHKALANLMWAYLIGHASLAVLHQATGHGVLRAMFTPASSSPAIDQ